MQAKTILLNAPESLLLNKATVNSHDYVHFDFDDNKLRINNIDYIFTVKK